MLSQTYALDELLAPAFLMPYALCPETKVFHHKSERATSSLCDAHQQVGAREVTSLPGF